MTLLEALVRDEGEVLHPYIDATGHKTIGVGHNLDAKPLLWYDGKSDITHEQAAQILKDDVDDACQDLNIHLPWTYKLDDVRFEVLINMTFNLGIAGLLMFHGFLAAMHDGEWENAGAAMVDSKWWHQVGDRAIRLRQQVITGERQ